MSPLSPWNGAASSGAVVGLLLLLFAGPALFAQGRTATLSGSVLDGAGGAVPGAVVTVEDLATGLERTTETDSLGGYRIPLLDPGAYRIEARSDGFKAAVVESVELAVDHATVVDIRLEIGQVVESMTVQADPALVSVSPGTVASLVDRETTDTLPLNGRDYVQLAALQLGAVQATAQISNSNNGRGLHLSIAGSRPQQNNFRLDGVSISDYTGSTPGSASGLNLGVEAIEEFSVLSNAYSAQYGRAAGGVINAVTRSGSNDFHGSGYWFHRNDNLDARNFFDREKPEFRRNQYGAALGGPIRENRTFFFANYEGLREERGRTTINTTFSDAARRGELTSGTVPVDPAAAQVVDLYPRANGETLGDTALFIFPNNVVGDEDFFVTRIDENLSDNDRLFFRYTLGDSELADQSAFAISDRQNGNRNQSASLEHTHIFSPTLFNSMRLGFNRSFTVSGLNEARVSGADDPALRFVPGARGMGILNISGLTNFPGGSGGEDTDIHAFNSFQLYDDATWNRGRHLFRFGFALERTHLNIDSQNSASGEYRFRGVSQFLQNIPDRFRAQLPSSDTIRGFRQWIVSGYAEDSYRVTQRLVLDLGVRYEFTTVPTEVNGKISNLDEITSPVHRVGDPLFDNPAKKNFAPRIGLAWDATGDGSTTVRAGYGIFHDLLLSPYLLLQGTRNPPFFVRANLRALDPGDFPNQGFPKLGNTGVADTRAERIPRDIGQPYVQQWNLMLTQRLPGETVFETGYLGSRGVRLSLIVEDANLVPAEVQPDGRLFFPADGEKINPNFAFVRDRIFEGSSFYHAWQSRLRKRFSHGLQFQGTYTFAKSIDDGSNTFAATEAVNAMNLPVPGNARFNRGLSNHDVRHSANLYAFWDVPYGSDAPLAALFANWRISPIMTYASGAPFSAAIDYDAARTQTARPDRRGGLRPDANPNFSGDATTGDPRGWMNLDAFSRPTPGFLGTLGRNTLTGPNLINFDLSLSKSVPTSWLGEGGALEFRAEFFNLFNRTNFDLPIGRTEVFSEDGLIEDAGRITSSRESREIQLGLKLRF